MPSWPTTIPQSPTVNGNSTSFGENRLIFNPDLGRPMMRRRFSIRDDVVAFSFIMSAAQFAIFSSFYKTDLVDGTLPFTYFDPTTGNTSTFQFKTPPQTAYLKPFYVSVSLSLLRFGT